MLSIFVFVVVWVAGVALADHYLSGLSLPWAMCAGYVLGMVGILIAEVFK